MKPYFLLSIFPVMAVVAGLSSSSAQGTPAVGYVKVAKIINAKCIGCHNGAGGSAGVDLSTYDSIMKGKFRGKALVVAKTPAKSVLVDAVYGRNGMKRMPFGPPLPAADAKLIEAWIAGGAKK